MSGIDDSSRLADTMAAHMALKVEDKQHMLEMVDVAKRLENLMTLMEGEVDILVAASKNKWKKTNANTI